MRAKNRILTFSVIFLLLLISANLPLSRADHALSRADHALSSADQQAPRQASQPSGQERGPAKGDEPVLVKVDTDLVAVDVTVTDPHGSYLLDLRAEDFELYEDGKKRQIEFFQPTGKIEQSPVSLVIALDLSGSLSADETVLQRNSIKQFIQMLDKSSLCALLGFNNKINILQDFTTDQKKLAHTLDHIKDYGGSTRIYDALDRAVTMLKKSAPIRSGRRMRRVILVITDGFDSASVIDKQELVRRANLSGVTIYSITLPSFAPGVAKSVQGDRLPTLLDVSRITDNTGGRDFLIRNNDFSTVFDAIAKELAAGYTLAYHPPKDNLALNAHKLEVRVKRDKALVRASRNSYVEEKK